MGILELLHVVNNAVLLYTLIMPDLIYGLDDNGHTELHHNHQSQRDSTKDRLHILRYVDTYKVTWYCLIVTV